MVIATDTTLSERFQDEHDPLWFLHEYFPVTCDIPDDREPEFGIIMDRMEIAHDIHEHFISHPLMRQVGETVPHDGFLVSLPQDTVDEDGHALHEIAALGLENRRRFNFNPITHLMSRYDVSFKTTGKGVLRQEWEAPAKGFSSGLKKALKLVASKHPEVSTITPGAFRVGGVCVASRASTDYVYMLSDESACILIENNDDACAMGNPHADILLGFRKEKEPEIKSVHLRHGESTSRFRLNAALDQGIEEIKDIVRSGHFANNISFATESKGAHAMRLAAEYYDAQQMYQGMEGRDIALLQNVKAETYLGKVNSIAAFAQTIPSSYDLSVGDTSTRYDQKFPTRTDSPKHMSPSRLQIVRPGRHAA